MRCKFKDRNGYCRHKNNQEHGRSAMKCVVNGCPYSEELGEKK